MKKIVTIGAYGYDEESFYEALKAANVDTFVDTRLRRGLRGSTYAFLNSNRLQEGLRSRGYRYVYLKELAPSKETRALQKKVDAEAGVTKRKRTGLSEAFIEGYKQQCLADYSSDSFLKAIGEEAAIVAIFCVEKTPDACHRSIVAEFLHEQLGTEVEHLTP